MFAAVKQFVAKKLVGSSLYAPVRHIYRRFSRVRSACTGNEVAFYSKFICPDDLVFDIGANAGYKTEIFLKCGAKVVSAEPNPLCHPVLDFEFSGNPRVSLVKRAVGSEETILPMNIRGLAPTSSLLDDWAPFELGYGRERVQVPVTTLDKMIEEFGRPSFIKIDVEGYETEVLKGLSSAVPYLSFEYVLRGKGLDRFHGCLKRLQSLSDIKINVIEDDSSSMSRELHFVFDTPRDPGDLTDLPISGDCFVIGKAV
jgi:FkbM family methyltransferase